MVRYRKASFSDYKQFAEIHLQAFDGFFLTTLGISFLNTYYFSCLKNKRTVAVCAYDERNEIIGFASGSVWAKGYNKHIIICNFHRFVPVALRIIFTKPLALVRLVNNLSKNNNENDKGDYAELLSIGILPSYKGKGVGKQILIEFEKEAVISGSTRISLTTDYYNNEDVVKFYQKSGYEDFYDFVTHPKRRMLKMIKILNNNSVEE